MYIHQKDLLWDLDKDFVGQIMQQAVKEIHGKAEVIFREGDPADAMYILTKGHIRLSIGDAGHSIYIVNHPGEGFGWSSIIGRGTYTATAQCVAESQVFKLDREPLNDLLEAHPEHGMQFYKKMAATLGARLLHLYENRLPAASVTTFGTRQVQDYPEVP